MVNMHLLTNTSNTSHSTYNISNGTTRGTGDPGETSEMYKQAMKFVSTIILVGILVANSLVIVLLLFRQKRKSRMGFFVANLAIADLAVGMFFVLPETVFSWFGVPWPEYFCYFYYGYFSMVAYYVSTYAIVVLTIDRLYVIVRPLSAAAKGKKYRYGLSLSAWVLGLLAGIQYAVHTKYYESSKKCEHAFPNAKVILYIDLFIFLLMPLTIITVCYVIIIVTIWKRERYGFVIAKTQNTDDDPQTKNKVINHAKIRTVKLLFVVVLAYALSWTPITSAAFCLAYGVLNHGNQFERTVVQSLYVLAPLNSLVNPLVFLVFNRKMFRKKETMQKVAAGSTTEQVCLTSEKR